MKENESITYCPTDAVINNASRGSALISLHYENEVDNEIKSLSKKLVKGKCTLKDVKDLYSSLLKAQDVYEPKKATEHGPTSGTCEYYALGGTAGLAWCREVLKSNNILKSYSKEITEEEMNTEDSSAWTKQEVTKSTNEELKQVLFIAMVPDLIDAHGDITTAEEISKACHNFNQFCGKANLLHLVETETFSIVESYISPSDFILNDRFVTKGTWLVNLQVHDDELWELVKSGEVNGVSIGALAKVENLKD